MAMERSGKTSSFTKRLFISNEKSNDGIIRVVAASGFRVATGIWNTGQEEQAVGSDSADLNYDSVAQKVADHSRGDKAEQRTFERSLCYSSFSLLAELHASRLKAIEAMEQERSRLKRSSKRQLFISNEKNNDGIIWVAPFHFRAATGLWNTGQEEQAVGSDSADLNYDSVAQKVADHSRGDKAEQRTFERSLCYSSFSLLAELHASRLKAIEAMEQERSRLKRSSKRQLFISNEKSNDGIIRVVPSGFRMATGIWNTGQEEQAVGSDSADLNYDSVAQKVADHSRGDKAEQRTFERSLCYSSFSLLAELHASRLKAIEAMEQERSRLKRSSKRQLFISNEKNNDGIIWVAPFHFRAATGLWNTGQEEQGAILASDKPSLQPVTILSQSGELLGKTELNYRKKTELEFKEILERVAKEVNQDPTKMGLVLSLLANCCGGHGTNSSGETQNHGRLGKF